MEARPKLTILEAAAQILKDRGQSHYKEVTREIQIRGLASLSGKTPWATVSARINSDIKRHGERSDFVRLAPGIFGVREDRSLARGSGEQKPAGQEAATDSDTATPQADANRRCSYTVFPDLRGSPASSTRIAGMAPEPGHGTPQDFTLPRWYASKCGRLERSRQMDSGAP